MSLFSALFPHFGLFLGLAVALALLGAFRRRPPHSPRSRDKP
ncbi:MAG TPA: hypothetical protein VJA19_06320 [Pseudomonas sp.]|nr:hypothetical protein [Pseudomonas sp.]